MTRNTMVMENIILMAIALRVSTSLSAVPEMLS